MFSFENHVKIAADSVEQLRRVDVFRLLNSVSLAEHMRPFGEWLVVHRPDLKAEVEECLDDLETPTK